MWGNSNTKLYCNGYLSDYIDFLFVKIKEKIYSYAEDYILGVNEEDFVKYIKDIYSIEYPVLKIEEAYIERNEKEIEVDPPIRYDRIGKIKKKILVIKYCIPIEGDPNLLQYQARHMSFTMGGRADRVYWYSNLLYAEFEDYTQNPENIRASINNFQDELLHNLQQIHDQLEETYTRQLDNRITNVFRNYKQEIQRKRDFVEAIDIPLKSNNNVATTFSVPTPKIREKIKVSCPAVKDPEFKPEPTLDKINYQKILSYINDVGKNFERLPSLCANKGEEDLRDHILLVLDPNFEMGTASGETFNKGGKTDIQLRYDSSVVFIAECKFWSGEKNYLKTIDQLLSYLTWRDSKAAVIVFSKNKEFTNVLNNIKQSTPKHSNFLNQEQDQSETWFNYKFHINGDRNRKIDLAVLAFNIPYID